MRPAERGPKLQALIERYRAGKVAPHVYVSDGASRDPECSVKRCRWSYHDHLDPELLNIVKEAVNS